MESITKIISDKLRDTLRVDCPPFFKKFQSHYFRSFHNTSSSISVHYIYFLLEVQSQNTESCSFLFNSLSPVSGTSLSLQFPSLWGHPYAANVLVTQHQATAAHMSPCLNHLNADFSIYEIVSKILTGIKAFQNLLSGYHQDPQRVQIPG